MRSAIVVAQSGMNDEMLQRLVGALKRAGSGPLMVKQVADAMHVSLTTAGKYVDVAEARGLVRVTPYASAKQVWLVDSSGKEGAGVR